MMDEPDFDEDDLIHDDLEQLQQENPYDEYDEEMMMMDAEQYAQSPPSTQTALPYETNRPAITTTTTTDTIHETDDAMDNNHHQHHHQVSSPPASPDPSITLVEDTARRMPRVSHHNKRKDAFSFERYEIESHIFCWCVGCEMQQGLTTITTIFRFVHFQVQLGDRVAIRTSGFSPTSHVASHGMEKAQAGTRR